MDLFGDAPEPAPRVRKKTPAQLRKEARLAPPTVASKSVSFLGDPDKESIEQAVDLFRAFGMTD